MEKTSLLYNKTPPKKRRCRRYGDNSKEKLRCKYRISGDIDKIKSINKHDPF